MQRGEGLAVLGVGLEPGRELVAREVLGVVAGARRARIITQERLVVLEPVPRSDHDAVVVLGGLGVRSLERRHLVGERGVVRPRLDREDLTDRVGGGHEVAKRLAVSGAEMAEVRGQGLLHELGAALGDVRRDLQPGIGGRGFGGRAAAGDHEGQHRHHQSFHVSSNKTAVRPSGVRAFAPRRQSRAGR